MNQVRVPFGKRVAIPVGQDGHATHALKRSHVVAIAAVGFAAVAGSLAASGIATRTPGAGSSATEATAEGTATPQSTGSRIPIILAVPIPSGRPAPAAAPGVAAAAAPAAQNTLLRGGFGETSRTMTSAPGRSTVSS